MKTTELSLSPGEEIHVSGPATIRFKGSHVHQQGDAPMQVVADIVLLEEEQRLSSFDDAID